MLHLGFGQRKAKGKRNKNSIIINCGANNNTGQTCNENETRRATLNNTFEGLLNNTLTLLAQENLRSSLLEYFLSLLSEQQQ